MGTVDFSGLKLKLIASIVAISGIALLRSFLALQIRMATKRRKKEAFSRWDAADYLKSDDDMAAYLQACLEEAPDDPALIAAALGDIARARGMMQLAKETGLTREGLYKALSKDGNPSLGTVLKVLKALGLKFTPQVV
jgi:probable addiction module antidote protein